MQRNYETIFKCECGGNLLSDGKKLTCKDCGQEGTNIWRK